MDGRDIGFVAVVRRPGAEIRRHADSRKKIPQLPAGPLFWRIDNFPTLAQAQAAAGPTALAAEVEGKA
jgi:hypothetical protein